MPAVRCPVLEWAVSGAMTLTGRPDGAPVFSPAPVLAMLGAVTEQLAQVTGQTGTAVRTDPAELLTGRAGLAGFSRGGRVSAGGASRLLRTADGWCAVTLSRPDDLDLVPAIVGHDISGDAWQAGESAAPRGTTADLADRAQLLGVPAAALPTVPATQANPDAGIPGPGAAAT